MDPGRLKRIARTSSAPASSSHGCTAYWREVAREFVEDYNNIRKALIIKAPRKARGTKTRRI